MRILVCGSRHFWDTKLFDEVLNYYWYPVRAIDVIIHGGAQGADTLADLWAESKGIYIEEYRAQWEKYGKAAGLIRNKQMLDEGKPDMVIAFLAPDSRGTANMIKQATEAGVEVKVINI